MDEFAALKSVVDTVELIDAHAHNVVAVDSAYSFLNCFSVATGEALSDVPHTITFKRSLREIAELYGTECSLEAIEEYRSRNGVESVSLKCLKAGGIHGILIDDGFDMDKSHGIEWHNKFVPFVGRILRVEILAMKIIDEGIADGLSWTLESFKTKFLHNLNSYSGNIVAFKSIAAYLTGLEINTQVSEREAEEALNDVVKGRLSNEGFITNKNFIDYIFINTLEFAQSFDLPIQIHTGFGDKHLDLRLSNPLHLRGVLEEDRFQKCRIVLLHASYPFSKEASYLASVYHQVYLDFGLAVPKLSFHGMVSSVKELLHLAPINKIMFSTDGFAFAESFYLGAKWAREVLFAVLKDTCADGDLSITEAIQAAKDILSQNAKHFYKI